MNNSVPLLPVAPSPRRPVPPSPRPPVPYGIWKFGMVGGTFFPNGV
ncbi:MAG TPA: hypothetical protein IGS52_19610 [Oscillatoriaceae cyanobacterium M33_DOE_052]|nr:hypothetical protein [Oscillatoriaceae cyanobacterium M33_DOE_052]